jgi:hypothetical protein
VEDTLERRRTSDVELSTDTTAMPGVADAGQSAKATGQTGEQAQPVKTGRTSTGRQEAPLIIVSRTS